MKSDPVTAIPSAALEGVAGGLNNKLTPQEIQNMFREPTFHNQLKLAEEAIERGWHIGRDAAVKAYKSFSTNPNNYQGFVDQANR